MKLSTRLSVPLVLTLATLTACEDETSTIGSSLVTDVTEIISDSCFTATGTTVKNAVVQSRTLTQLLGRLDAKEYGDFSSDFVCQFLPAMSLDTVGVSVNDIDSVTMVMFMNIGDYTGDSLTPMGLEVFQLTRQLPSPIYSNFNPDGYYNPAQPIGSKIYTAHAMHNDSIGALSFRSVTVPLPTELGKQLFTYYKQQPDLFANPKKFAEKFPGLYVTNSFGSGRVINIDETRINIHYSKHGKDTVNGATIDTIYNKVTSYFAVTPEVITNNNISLTMSQQLDDMINGGKTIIVAPTGTEVKLSFPAVDLVNYYKNAAGRLAVLNSIGFTIPVNIIENDYNINPPEYVLLILEKDKDKFFANNKITDNKTSFTGTYSESRKAYIFPDMRQYILDLIEKDNIAAEDYTFVITPVNIETETTSGSYYSDGTTYVTTISPYVTKPAMADLDIENSKIKITFTRQSAN